MSRTTKHLNNISPDFLKEVEEAAIWQPYSVDIEPVTHLENWRVYLVQGNFCGAGSTIHLTGWADRYEGRVCSPLKAWNETTKKAITRSGRVYELIGNPGYHPDAAWTFERWLMRNGNPDFLDITEDFIKGKYELPKY